MVGWTGWLVLVVGVVLLTLTLVLSHQGRGDSVGCFVFLPPALHLWIADQVRNDVGVVAGGSSAWRIVG